METIVKEYMWKIVFGLGCRIPDIYGSLKSERVLRLFGSKSRSQLQQPKCRSIKNWSFSLEKWPLIYNCISLTNNINVLLDGT